MSEVISSFRSLRAGSQVFALLILFLCVIFYVFGQEPAVAMHLALWYVVLVCHQYDVCENSVGSVYIGGYGGLSESGECVYEWYTWFRCLPFSGSAWPTCPKTVNRAPIAGGGNVRHNLHSSLCPL